MTSEMPEHKSAVLRLIAASPAVVFKFEDKIRICSGYSMQNGNKGIHLLYCDSVVCTFDQHDGIADVYDAIRHHDLKTARKLGLESLPDALFLAGTEMY